MIKEQSRGQIETRSTVSSRNSVTPTLDLETLINTPLNSATGVGPVQ